MFWFVPVKCRDRSLSRLPDEFLSRILQLSIPEPFLSFPYQVLFEDNPQQVRASVRGVCKRWLKVLHALRRLKRQFICTGAIASQGRTHILWRLF